MEKERERKQLTELLKVFLKFSLEEVKNEKASSYLESLGVKENVGKKAFGVGVQRPITLSATGS